MYYQEDDRAYAPEEEWWMKDHVRTEGCFRTCLVWLVIITVAIVSIGLLVTL